MKVGGHSCWQVQKALDRAGIPYAVIAGPVFRSRRVELERLSGQRLYPVIEFEDGSIYREDAAEMAARIDVGKLADVLAPPRSAAEPGQPPSAPTPS